MTRRLTGSLHSSRPRSPYILPIGHLSNKSSVYSPVSMSHMSQDLVYNHMKSHYQRIASAKACVDTARPKSMKLTIKGRDRKRRETLQRSFETTLDRPSSCARQTHSPWKDNSRNVKEEDASFLEGNSVLVHRKMDHSETMPVDEVRGHGRESRSRKGEGFSAGEEYNIGKKFRSKSSRKDGGEDIEGSRINNMKSDKNNGSCSSKDLSEHSKRNQLEFDENGYRNYQRTNKRTEYDDLPLTDSSGLQNNDSLKQTGILGGTQIDRLFTSTPREHEEEDFLNHSNPQISNVSFSYKEPPSPRRKNKKSSQEVIWTEEQKYLNFISDVTTDILARGIFSNRVLSRVFESHIEKRKDDLDEEHMREMINQLKQDLGITDYINRMFITVLFGDNRQEIFNPDCKVCVLLDNIKDRCDCLKEDIIDLSDQSGERKNLRLNPMDYAIKHVDEREILILIKIERFPGSLNDTCVPLLHSLRGDTDFLQTLNKNLNEVPNSQNDSEKQRPSHVFGRRASMNIRKQKSNFAVGGPKRSTRTTRSQSIAVAGGISGYSKLLKKGR